MPNIVELDESDNEKNDADSDGDVFHSAVATPDESVEISSSKKSVDSVKMSAIYFLFCSQTTLI